MESEHLLYILVIAGGLAAMAFALGRTDGPTDAREQRLHAIQKKFRSVHNELERPARIRRALKPIIVALFLFGFIVAIYFLSPWPVTQT